MKTWQIIAIAAVLLVILGKKKTATAAPAPQYLAEPTTALGIGVSNEVPYGSDVPGREPGMSYPPEFGMQFEYRQM